VARRSSLISRLRKNWISCLVVFALVGFLIFTFWPRDLVRTIDNTMNKSNISEITVMIFFPGPKLKEWSIEDKSHIEDLFIALKGQSMRKEVFTPGIRYGKINRDPAEPWSVQIHVYHDEGHGRGLTRINFFDGRTSEVVEINSDSYVLYGDGSELIWALLGYAEEAGSG